MMLGLLGLPSISAQGNNNNIYFENDYIAIRVTGNQNVPMFQFWRPTDDATLNETTRYQIKFIKLFEYIDTDGDNIYNPENESKVPASTDALASLSWDFTEIITDDANVSHFNMTSLGRDYTIQFRNHFDPSTASIKFDIVLEEYTFISDDENAALVLGFHLITVNQEMVQEQNQIRFGNQGYFEVEPEAIAEGNETVEVGLSNGEENDQSMAFIAFPRFEGKLVHDPTMGFLTEEFDPSDIESDDSDDTVPGYTGIALGFVALVSILTLIHKNRK